MRAQPQVPSLCIDETSLSCGELYTVVTNRAGRGGRGTLVTMIRGTKSEDVIKVLEMIHVSKRKTVKEVTLDLSPTMMRIVRMAFPNATMTNDRFHVQKLFYEAIDELRITYRWMARDLENDEIQRCREQGIEYVPFRYANGDTRKQLLARAKHVLVKHFSKWTESQRIRAEIIFKHYPELKSVYDLAIELTNIYNKHYDKDVARGKISKKSLVSLFLQGNTSLRHLVLMSLRWTDSVRMMRSLMPNTGKWNRRRQNQRLMIMQYRMSRRAMLLTEIM